jgi:endonuclease YncB( thermonuclease family)
MVTQTLNVPSNDVAIDLYDDLFKEVTRIHGEAHRALATAYWEIGRRIIEIEQDKDVISAYGSKLLRTLADDLSAQNGGGFSLSNLKRMRKFFLANQKSPTSDFLSWSQHVELLNVTDSKEREKLQKRAVAEKISARALRAIVKSQEERNNAAKAHIVHPKMGDSLIRPRKLELHTYKLLQNSNLSVGKGYVLVDCGFFINRRVANLTKDLNIVSSPSYTYAAIVDRVVDGDTIIAYIDVGFDTMIRERLRLRHIDTPEFSTPEGAAAKIFVQDHLPEGKTIVVKTQSRDKYGRYLADVFCKEENATPQEIIQSGMYLNDVILKAGYASRYVG